MNPQSKPTKSIEAVDTLLDKYSRRMAITTDPLTRRKIRGAATAQILQLIEEARIDELESLKQQTMETTHPQAHISAGGVAQSILIHTNSLIEHRLLALKRSQDE